MNLNPFMHQNQILDGEKNQNIYYVDVDGLGRPRRPF